MAPRKAIEPGAPVSKKDLFIEVGTTGLRRSGGYIDADFLPQLNGRRGAQTYYEMSSNDPLISALVFAVSMFTRKTKWTVKAPDNSGKEGKKFQALVEDCLFNGMTSTWQDVLAEAVTMFTYGFAPMEIVWKKHADGFLVPASLSLRSQDTLERWEFDPDTFDLQGMWQNDYLRPMVFIPMYKLLLFRTETAKGNPEGRSILRGSYISWMRKKTIEEAEGRAALRAAGLVVARVPSSTMLASASGEEKAAFNAMLVAANALAQDRQGAIVLPSNVWPDAKGGGKANGYIYDVQYVVAPGRQAADMSPIIERIDKRILSTVLADWILLGQQATGSYSLSSDKTAMFAEGISAWLDILASTFNRQLLPRWWTYNGWDPAAMPSLIPGDLKEPALADLGMYIKNLAGSGMTLFPDPELEEHLRDRADLPQATPETLKLQDDLKQQAADQQQGGEPAQQPDA